MQVEHHRDRNPRPDMGADGCEQFALHVVGALGALRPVQEQEDPVDGAGSRQIGEHLVAQGRPVG